MATHDEVEQNIRVLSLFCFINFPQTPFSISNITVDMKEPCDDPRV